MIRKNRHRPPPESHKSLPSKLPSLRVPSSSYLSGLQSDTGSSKPTNYSTKINYHTNLSTSSKSTNSSISSNSISKAISSQNQKSKISKSADISIPKSDIDNLVLNNQISFDTIIVIEKEHTFSPSKKFEPGRPNEFAQLFIEKCHEVQNYAISKENVEIKQSIFEDLISSFNFPNLIRKLDQGCAEEILNVFTQNILVRSFPKITSLPPAILFDRIENYYDRQWSILVLSYKLLNLFMVSSYITPNLLMQTISQEFISKLFRCFQSPDSRERQEVKSILYAIAGRIPERGMIIMSLMRKSVIDSINDEPIHWGLPQILELFTSIITSIPQYTRSNFDDILKQYLLPLHLSHQFTSFSTPILNLVKTVIQKNPKELASIVVSFLLNHFPAASQKKQIAFIKEIEEIVKNNYKFITPTTTKLLFERISMLYSDDCAEIAEQALLLIYADGFHQLLSQYFQSIAPLLFYRAQKVSKIYWYEPISMVALTTMQEISRIDPDAFAKVTANFDSFIQTIANHENEREKIWNLLQSPSDDDSYLNQLDLHSLQSQPLNSKGSISSNTSFSNKLQIKSKAHDENKLAGSLQYDPIKAKQHYQQQKVLKNPKCYGSILSTVKNAQASKSSSSVIHSVMPIVTTPSVLSQSRAKCKGEKAIPRYFEENDLRL